MSSSLKARPHRSVVLVAVATAISLLGDQALYAVLPTCYDSMGLRPFQVGVLLSANRWIRLLTNHLAESLTRRLGPGPVLAAALVLGGLLTISYGVWPLFSVLLAARILWGLCWSCIRQVGIMKTMDTAPVGGSGKIMGFYDGVSRLGSTAGLLGGAILFDWMGFSPAMVVLGVLSLAAVAPAAAARRWMGGHSAFHACDGKGRADNAPWLLACGFVVGCVASGIITSSLGYVLKKGMSEQIAVGSLVIGVATVTGAMLAAQYVINILGAPALGAVQDRMGHRPATVMFFIAGAGVLAAAAAGPPIALLLGLVVLFFICTTALNVVLSAEAGRFGSKAYAAYATAADLGSAVGPLLVWTLLEKMDSPGLAFALGAILFAVGAAAAIVRLARRPRAGEQAEPPAEVFIGDPE
ncbi:MAG: MFS transporter [Planctomycetaceae bacterium]|nr:MFS transporter [Planctomycetaceae bacterium]